MKLTLQIHDSMLGWLDAGELVFFGKNDVSIEYDLDYACKHLEQKGSTAFSVQFPVSVAPYRGPVPGYLVDLVPQGNILKRLLNRYGITQDDDYSGILSSAPLASPGNLRVKEPWIEIERKRPTYTHRGFSKAEIINAKENFVEYMENHGAPVGGTSGAAGGAPKFLLREDFNGQFHADGYLDDILTKQAYLIKFPFTDSSNSRLLTQVEKTYYDLLRDLPVKTGAAIEIHDDILFIPRFERIRKEDGRLHYHGLESLYSAHGVNNHGQRLSHEDNLHLIKNCCNDWQANILEYVIRDILNQILCNNDNHGRNTSLIKIGEDVSLSPIYDITAMKFFTGDFIVPLTNWESSNLDLTRRIKWISQNLSIETAILLDQLIFLRDKHLLNFQEQLYQHFVPEDIIIWSKGERDNMLAQLARL